MANNIIRVGNAEIMSLSDGLLEFDLCNFFPTHPAGALAPYEWHLTAEQHVRFNLGSFLVRSEGRTILVDTGLGPKPQICLMPPGANSCMISAPMACGPKTLIWW